MLLPMLSRGLEWLSAAAAEPDDSDDVRLRKSLLLAATSTLVVAASIWGLMYLAMGHFHSSLIPLVYALITATSIAVYVVTRAYRLFSI